MASRGCPIGWTLGAVRPCTVALGSSISSPHVLRAVSCLHRKCLRSCACAGASWSGRNHGRRQHCLPRTVCCESPITVLAAMRFACLAAGWQALVLSVNARVAPRTCIRLLASAPSNSGLRFSSIDSVFFPLACARASAPMPQRACDRAGLFRQRMGPLIASTSFACALSLGSATRRLAARREQGAVALSYQTVHCACEVLTSLLHIEQDAKGQFECVKAVLMNDVQLCMLQRGNPVRSLQTGHVVVCLVSS